MRRMQYICHQPIAPIYVVCTGWSGLWCEGSFSAQGVQGALLTQHYFLSIVNCLKLSYFRSIYVSNKIWLTSWQDILCISKYTGFVPQIWHFCEKNCSKLVLGSSPRKYEVILKIMLENSKKQTKKKQDK